MPKKYFGILVLLLVGCSTTVKTSSLICSHYEQDANSEIIFTYQDEALISVKSNTYVDISNYNAKIRQSIMQRDLCAMVKERITKYQDAIESCKHEISGDTLIISSNLSVDKLNKEEKVKTITEALEGLEQTGYVCHVRNSS